MHARPASLKTHRIQTSDRDSVARGEVRYSPFKSAWPHVGFHRISTADRLSTGFKTATMRGLPALSLTLCTRVLPIKVIALSALPLAVAYEYM